ncbi:MAG: pyruvate formate lyase-activating protein [Oscillospiraceae bacterium]|nr:pyruvate formate lyase-activating protein [Oscillospiraceae bacterium]
MTGNIHSIQSLGTVDGPGIRCVVFMQGCPLRCGYCHNPDTWDRSGGEVTTPEAVFQKIRRFKPYFKKDGGITVSGGEPLLQADFVRELFALCKADGIHTCLDTSGCIRNAGTDALLELTDLVLLDIKMTDDDSYRRHIGCPMEKPLAFLDLLEERGIPAWIRQVIVPGVNDTDENISRLNGILAGRKNIERVQLLPFKKICVTKYEQLGIPFPFDVYPHCPAETIERLSGLIG